MNRAPHAVTLRDIVLAVRYGDAAMVGESCGYLVLGAGDRMLDLPRRLSLDAVSVTSEGQVEVDAAPCTHSECERGLRQVLAQLLSLVRTPHPNLARVAARAGATGMEHLVRELEAALIPVNRRAARRSLARLARDAARSAAKSHHALAVDVLHDVEPEAGPPHDVEPEAGPPHDGEPHDVELDALAPESVPAKAPETCEFVDVTDEVLDWEEQPENESLGAILPEVPPGVGRRELQVQELAVSRKPTLPMHPSLVQVLASNFGTRTPSEALPRVDEVATGAGFDEHPPPHANDEGASDDVPADAMVVATVEDETPTRLLGLEVAYEDEEPTRVTSQVEALESSPSPQEQTRLERPVVRTEESGPSSTLTRPTGPAVARELGRQDPPRSARPVGRRAAPLARDACLIPATQGRESTRRSDVAQLLDRMSVRQESEERLLSGLKSLSKVELSPACPPVAPAWVDD